MNPIKLKCVASTYIDEFNLNKNFVSKEYILSGIVYRNSSNFNNFKSLVEFNISSLNISNLKTNGIKTVVLGLFINDLNFSYASSANIKIIGTTNNIANVTWSNYSSLTSSKELVTEISTNMIGKYVEIDITDIFKEGLPYKNNYGVTIDIIKHNYTSIIQFASVNSSYPPYLMISIITDDNKADKTKVKPKSDETLVPKVRQEGNDAKGEDFEVLLSNFESLNSKLYILEQSLSSKVDSLAEWIKSINIKVDSLGEWSKSTNTKVDALGEWVKLTNTKVVDLGELVKAANIKVDSLAEGINETNSNVEYLKSGVNETINKVESLGGEVDSTNKKVEYLRDDINKNNNKVESLRVDINENNNKVEKLRELIDLTNEKVDLLGEEFKESTSKLGKDIININSMMLKVDNNTKKLVKLVENMTIETFE